MSTIHDILKDEVNRMDYLNEEAISVYLSPRSALVGFVSGD